nr:MAG TPA: hypothetical protein [Caudoviricetes sp.]
MTKPPFCGIIVPWKGGFVMVKFKVGQTVKYIGRNGLFSPLR